jgi:fibronectin-binding autotransporter adhesin
MKKLPLKLAGAGLVETSLFSFLCTAFFLGLAPVPVHASYSTYSWDSDGIFSNGQTDGSGTISSTATNFMHGGSADILWTNGQALVIGVAGSAASQSYTINNTFTNISFATLVFQGGAAYTLSGNSMQVGNGSDSTHICGITLNADVLSTETIAAQVNLSATNTFTNNATNSSGLLNISGAITPNSPSGGGILNLAGTGVGTNTISGFIHQGGVGLVSLNVTGGKWVLSNANLYTGAVTLTGGVLSIDSDYNLGGSAGTVNVSSVTSGTSVTLVSSPSAGKLGVGTQILGTTIGVNTSLTAFSLAANSNQSISSATTVAYATASNLNLNGGTLQANGTFSLSESASANGYTSTANRAIVLGAAGGTINVTASNVLTTPGIISGNGSLTKTNSGKMIVSGSNTYSGTTNVNGGTFLANNANGSATGSGAVIVASGAIFGGAGTINPQAGALVTIQNGGILAPGSGDSTTDALTISAASNTTSGLLTLAAGAKLDFNLGLGNTASSLSLTSSFANEVSGLSGAIFNFTDLTSGSLALGKYTLIQSDSSTANPFGLTTSALAGFDLSTSGLSTYLTAGDTLALEVNQLAGTNNYALQLDIVSVPEPTTWALLVGGVGMLVFGQKLRNRRSQA